MAREFELKFTVDPAAMSRLASHPLLAGAAPSSEHLVSTYYDTARSDLRRRRLSLRVRVGDRATVQTLKRSGHSLVDRDEWEMQGGGAPDLAWLRTTPLAAVFAEDALAGGMDPRFTVDVQRTILPIDYAGTRIEGAIDSGAINAGDASLPVHEIELEHKGGPRDGVVALVRHLARDLPLVLSLASKAERGYAVADRNWGRPSKDIPVDLTGARTVEAVFTSVLQGCLHALCRNALLIGDGGNEEAVHKTRIALRHIRAAFALFAPALRRKGFDHLARDLKWMSDRLGAARDADVFAALVSARGASVEAGGPGLATVLAPRRRRVHARLSAALSSARWRLLLIDLLAFSIDGVRRARREERAAPFLRRRLRRLRRRVGRDARGMASVPAGALHDLRKRAKMLRYDLDLVGTVPDLGIASRRIRRTAADLQVLQEELGAIHDAEGLAARLDALVLARHAAPKSVARAAWPGVVAAAQAMAARPPVGAALKKAAKAGKHMRKRAF